MDDVRKSVAGARAPRLHPADQSAEDSSSIFIPLRLVLQPSGLVMELNRPDMLIGRHSQADMRLPLPDVSRRHCRFVFTNGRWHVIDLHSLNGVYVNAERVDRAILHDHDTIAIGGFRFHVELAHHASAQPSGRDSDKPIQRIVQGLPPADTDFDPQRKAS